jgi:hypothetical protein
MRCQKHPESWIGLNGPGYCQSCARESEALCQPDAPSCSPSPDVRRCGAVTITRNGYVEQLESELSNIRELYGSLLVTHQLCSSKLTAALAALGAIEERYVDGCDTYEDWRFMGNTARAALAD